MLKRFKTNKNFRSRVLSFGIVLAAYLVLQAMSAAGALSSTMKGQLIPICAYVLMALSLNLTVGILGELSLGHAGFMSVGAFSGVIVATCLQNTVTVDWLRLVLSLLVGALLAGIVGFLIGIPVLRLNGDYLAIVTLAFGEIIKSIVNNLYVGLDGSGLHINFLNNTMSLGEGGRMILNGAAGITSVTKISTFTVGVILILLVLALIYNLVESRTGRAIMALRDNRIAAQSIGINVTKYKMIGFVISAAIAGAAGALYAQAQNTIIASKFDFNQSISILVFVVLGGMGSMTGSIIAAAVLTVLPEMLRSLQDYRMLIYAIVLILMMLFNSAPGMIAWRKKMAAKLKATGGSIPYKRKGEG